VPAAAFMRGEDLEYLRHQGEHHSTGEQAVYRLYGRDNKHCGLCFESMIPPNSSVGAALPPSFVGTAQHGESDMVAFKGPNRVEGNIPLFEGRPTRLLDPVAVS